MKMLISSDNIFEDLGYKKNEAYNLKVRADLMIHIAKYIKKTHLTQEQAANLFCVTQPRISNLLSGKIDLFTIDMLINMLMKAGMSVDVHVSNKKAA